MITQLDVNQFKDIVDAIEKDISESVRFVKAFELCNVVFKTAKFDMVKLSEDKEFALDASSELDGVIKSLNALLSPLLNQIDSSYVEFKSSAKANISDLEKLVTTYEVKQKELKELKHTQEEYEKLEIKLDQINSEIDGYEKIDIEKIQQEIINNTRRLDELKKEKEPLVPIWEKHLDENKKIDITSDTIEKTAEEIEQKLKEMDALIGSYI